MSDRNATYRLTGPSSRSGVGNEAATDATDTTSAGVRTTTGTSNPNRCEIVAVSDLIPERCAGLARDCRCAKTYPSLEEMVKDGVTPDMVAAMVKSWSSLGDAGMGMMQNFLSQMGSTKR